jgi:hypothetical protein
MDSPIEPIKTYRVEVSGWDAADNFFVERATLDWEQDARKTLQLQSAVREGCVLFVRLLQPSAVVTNFPIAYQVVAVGDSDAVARTRVSLMQLRPRLTFKEKAELEQSSETKVA